MRECEVSVTVDEDEMLLARWLVGRADHVGPLSPL